MFYCKEIPMSTVSAIFLILLAIAHSTLGENDLLQPLFKLEWDLPSVPRWAAEKIFRFAWHLTSIAWLALAGIMMGYSPALIIAIQSFFAATLIFVMLRGHLAWPLFLGAAGTAFFSEYGASDFAIQIAISTAATGLIGVGVLHLYWAFGGRWLAQEAIPSTPSGPIFNPPKMLTFGVAFLLFLFSYTLIVQAFFPTLWSYYGTLIISLIMILRSNGDFKYAGFTKSFRNSSFAKYDDLYFTPFVTLIALLTGFSIALS